MSVFFFFNDTATTEIYTLSLHDALPISSRTMTVTPASLPLRILGMQMKSQGQAGDRKSTRLNSSHSQISYAVFCLKKKTNSKSRCYLCHLIYRNLASGCPVQSCCLAIAD